MSEIGIPKSYSKRKIVCSFKGDPELWSDFKGACALAGVSVCYVQEGLMKAWIEAQKVEATLLKPVHIELHMEHVVQRPRCVKTIREPWDHARSKNWPPSCEHADDFVKATKEVLCLELKDAVSLEKCWRCFLAKGGPS